MKCKSDMWQKACKQAGAGGYAKQKESYGKMTKACECDQAGRCAAPDEQPTAAKGFQLLAREVLAKAGGPYIGPKGGKWADQKHTIPWKEGGPKRKRSLEHTEEEKLQRKYYEKVKGDPLKAGLRERFQSAVRSGDSAALKVAMRFASPYDTIEVARGLGFIGYHARDAAGYLRRKLQTNKAAKGFQLLARETMAKAGAYVGTPQQGVPFSGPFSPLVPSNMAGPKAKPVTQDDLPDSAFLLIEEGGRRDAKGRTDPRELRKYQARDVDGMFDGALLKACVKAAKDDGYSAVVRKARDILSRIGGSEA